MENQHSLVTGGREDPFLPKLLRAINSANEIRCAVSFIRLSGLDLIFDALVDALDRRAVIQILTSDYMDITEPRSLRRLMILSERGADVRIYCTRPDQGFHIKSYIFTREEGGCAFVGSSNLSNMALTTGLEWNLRVDSSDDPARFQEILLKFNRLLEHDNVRLLSHEIIADYIKRRKVEPRIVEATEVESFVPAVPNQIQQDALVCLENSRNAGFERGLVVLATGLGKTWLAAFDAKQIKADRVLFVAHREEILLQAEATFSHIAPDASIGRYTGIHKELGSDFLFASVQTLGSEKHLSIFDEKYFDYIVIDEFHHATAASYRRLIDHFKPKFMLGLTATPNRTDHADILSLCDNNLVFEKNFVEGINAKQLCPFRYYGIFDKNVDYTEIPWRNGRFDPEALSNKLATTARAKHVFLEWKEKSKKQKRTLAFCVSRKHADFMSRYFLGKGVKVAAVYAESELPRSEALARLESGSLEILFSVDLFNEGMDLPAIDVVMMLRPTESKILYLQQLGRGLRLFPDKPFLLVLDFIANHKSFFKRPTELFGVKRLDEIPARHRSQGFDLPSECFVQFDLESIDFIRAYNQALKSVAQGTYEQLRNASEQRPSAVEMFRAGIKFGSIRDKHKSWFDFVASLGDLNQDESEVLAQNRSFFQNIELSRMTRSFKMILLESLLELDGFFNPQPLDTIAKKSAELLCRRPQLFNHDVPKQFSAVCDSPNVATRAWISYWNNNPVNAFIGGNSDASTADFYSDNIRLIPSFTINPDYRNTFHQMVREMVDYRLAMYITSKGLGPNLGAGYMNENRIIPEVAEPGPDQDEDCDK